MQMNTSFCSRSPRYQTGVASVKYLSLMFVSAAAIDFVRPYIPRNSRSSLISWSIINMHAKYSACFCAIRSKFPSSHAVNFK